MENLAFYIWIGVLAFLLIVVSVFAGLCYGGVLAPLTGSASTGAKLNFKKVGIAQADGHSGSNLQLFEATQGNQYKYELRNDKNQAIAVLQLPNGAKITNNQKIQVPTNPPTFYKAILG